MLPSETQLVEALSFVDNDTIISGNNIETANNDEEDTSHHVEQEIMESSPILVKRNPMHDRHPATRLKDYVTFTARHPITELMSYQKIFPTYATFLNTITNHCEPQSFQIHKVCGKLP